MSDRSRCYVSNLQIVHVRLPVDNTCSKMKEYLPDLAQAFQKPMTAGHSIQGPMESSEASLACLEFPAEVVAEAFAALVRANLQHNKIRIRQNHSSTKMITYLECTNSCSAAAPDRTSFDFAFDKKRTRSATGTGEPN